MNTLQNHQHIFIVGVKGVAMAGIMTMLAQMGKKVSGSDTDETQITDGLVTSSEVHVQGLDSALPDDVDLLIYSAAHGGSLSSQVKQANAKGIPVMHQAQAIRAISALFTYSIAICGCHGKTGTTALTVFVLKQLDMSISWLVGTPSFYGEDESGAIIGYAGAHFDPESTIFVYECDEYAVSPPQDLTPKLEFYSPTHAICTNIDYDHPDVYRDIEHTRSVFHSFFKRCGWVYECNSKSIEGNKQGVVKLIEQLRDEGLLEPQGKSQSTHAIMKRFGGAKRRLEDYGESQGIHFYDDYGHHPAEIKATIHTLRAKYPNRRLVILFQSHTYSRTLRLRNEFVDALTLADLVYIDQVFPSAREKSDAEKITSQDLEVLATQKGYTNIHGCASREDLIQRAKLNMRTGDVLLTLGAGDIYKVIPILEAV